MHTIFSKLKKLFKLLQNSFSSSLDMDSTSSPRAFVLLRPPKLSVTALSLFKEKCVYARSLFSKIFLFLLPPACYGCGSLLDDFLLFCYDCDKKIIPIATHYFKSSGLRIPVIAVSNYDYPLKKLILAKNYNHINSAYALGQIIWEKSVLKNLNFDIIIPIPLHWTRKYRRGYNQTEEIAKAISKLSGKPVLKALKRIKKTKFQATLNKQGRSDNLKNAFEVRDIKSINNKKILLVDDLMTTGSTFESAVAEIFKRTGTKDIICVVPCRVV